MQAYRRDTLRLPRPDLSLSLGSPNACTQCHRDRQPQWAAAAMDRWYGKAWRERPHYGKTLHAARTQGARALPDLLQLAASPSAAAIVRATAATLAQPYANPATLPAASALLQETDPSLRIAALGLLASAEPAKRVLAAAPLLSDAVRGVRIEAANVLADLPDSQLPADRRAARQAAQQEYEAALALEADWPSGQVNLGNLRLRQGRSDEAVAAFERAISLDRQFPDAYVNLADCWRQQGREAAAAEVLRRGIAELPRDADLHHALGLLLVRTGQAPAAVNELGLAARLAPDNPRHAYVHARGASDAPNEDCGHDRPRHRGTRAAAPTAGSRRRCRALNAAHADMETHSNNVAPGAGAGAASSAAISACWSTARPENPFRPGGRRRGGTRERPGVHPERHRRRPRAMPSRRHDPARSRAVGTPGDDVYLADGAIVLRVLASIGNDVRTEVVRGGTLRSRKGMHLPRAEAHVEPFTDRDALALEMAIAAKVDFLGLSFVRRAEDVERVRAMLPKRGVRPALVPKIETAAAIDNLAGIVRAADAVMVARGDLGIQMPARSVPLLQKEIIRFCNLAGKPVITATQMLESMTRSPLPTRAEVNDVANAVLDGTDALMLSDHALDSDSACLSTNSTASGCLSGGYFHFCRHLRTRMRSLARTLSRTCQSTEVLARSFSVISMAIFFSTSSPSSRTALSLLASAS
jgi:tetratricopeptide (TPR) repeat protein